jgi:hypothetical protein
MPKNIRKRTASKIDNTPSPLLSHHRGSQQTRRILGMALCTGLACMILVQGPRQLLAAEATRSSIGERYIFNNAAGVESGAGPAQALRSSLGKGGLDQGGLQDPASRIWAGAQGLRLSLDQSSVLLATNVIAACGDDESAAASHADGSIQLFGTGNCTSVNMPDGDPAYALALAKEGGALAAWAQGVNRLVIFDLKTQGCSAVSADTALRGQISLSLSASGAFLAAQDESGKVWVGPRGGVMRIATSLHGAPAAIGFSGGEGVLLVLDANGQGGAWNARTGERLRSLTIPGGPFVRGDFQGMEARLWTRDGRLVRWDMLHNNAVTTDISPVGPFSGQKEGWLALRGANLFYERPGRSWQATPVYDPRLPSLDVSTQAACLRLADVDGNVRYFSSRTGEAQPQCFADDWSKVVVSTNGTAQIPGLALRIFDSHRSLPDGSKINIRAISETEVYVWTANPAELDLRVQAPLSGARQSMQGVVDANQGSAIKPISAQLRKGIAASAPAKVIMLQ